MLGFFKMFVNFLQFFTCFVFYTWGRLFCKVLSYLRPSCGLSESQNLKQPSTATSGLDFRLLENKIFAYATKIVFLPIYAEVRLFNGRISGLNTLTSKHSVKMDWYVKTSTASVVDEINVNYEGLLRFMNSKFNFTISAALEKVQIFTEFNVFPYGSESILDYLHIDDMRLELNIFNFTFCNTTSYIVLRNILKIVSFFVSCLIEYMIALHLRLKFSSTDFFKMHHHKRCCLKSSLKKYYKSTKNANKISHVIKSFISSLNDVLVEDNRKMLAELFPHLNDKIQKQGEDYNKKHGKDGNKEQEEDGNLKQVEDGNLKRVEDGNLKQVEDGNLKQVEDGNKEQDEEGKKKHGENGNKEQGEDGSQKEKFNESHGNKLSEKTEKPSACEEIDVESQLNDSEVITEFPDTDAESDSYNYYFVQDKVK